MNYLESTHAQTLADVLLEYFDKQVRGKQYARQFFSKSFACVHIAEALDHGERFVKLIEHESGCLVIMERMEG